MKKLFYLFLFLSALTYGQGFPVTVSQPLTSNIVSYDQVLRAYDVYGSSGATSLQWAMNSVSDITISFIGLSDAQFVVEGSNDGRNWKSISVYELSAPQTLITGNFQPSTSELSFYKVSNLAFNFLRVKRSVQGTSVSGTKSVQVYVNRSMPVKAIELWGDSMTAGAGSDTGYTIGYQLSYDLPEYLVTANAIGSQKSGQILARQHGFRITMPGVVDNQDRAIGALSSDFLKNPGNVNLQSGGLYKGLSCVIKYNPGSTPQYTIRTAGANESISNIANTNFIPFDALNARNSIQVLWFGRNDSANGNGTFADIIPNLQKAIDFLAPPKRFVVVGVAPNTSEVLGSAYRTALDGHNTALQATWPLQYVSAYPPTTTEMAEVGYVPTAQDLTDISNGLWPASHMVDPTHFNSIGYRIMTYRIEKTLQGLKYI